MVIIFFAIGNIVSMVFTLCVIFSALALARSNDVEALYFLVIGVVALAMS